MSQNKTIIPDVDYGTLGTAASQDTYSDFYRPSSFNQSAPNRTYVAGSYEPPVEQSQVAQSIPSTAAMGRHVELQERVMTGVLFSISKGLLGEIFPLYLGRNLVGFTPECDIRLNERTVSAVHALIQVYKDFDTNLCEISVTDYGSSYGTLVNGERGDFGSLSLKENDILTIGHHYKFIVKLFNAEQFGLYEDPEFDDTMSHQDESPQMSNDFYAPSKGSDSNRTVIY